MTENHNKNKQQEAHVGGKALYYHYGQENYCYRWCMEDGVTFGWRTEYLKYMAKTSIAGGDYKVARKYIDMLKRTLFHKEWAEKYETYLDHPEQIRKSKEFAPIIRLLPKEDKLNSDLNVIEMFLLRTFAYGESDDPLYQEQTLIAALQMKDIDIFWPRFFQYATLHNGKPMPRHYQEAAYLYGHLENKVDISHMPFDQDVKDSYQRFMEFTQQCAGMTEAQMAEAFRPQFGNTFYYFYFLVNGLQTY
jgi:AraC-like DNA-binding protein